jgi:hypothetical protein
MYQNPVLLIEFDRDKAFSLQHPNEIGQVNERETYSYIREFLFHYYFYYRYYVVIPSY